MKGYLYLLSLAQAYPTKAPHRIRVVFGASLIGSTRYERTIFLPSFSAKQQHIRGGLWLCVNYDSPIYRQSGGHQLTTKGNHCGI